ncbi:Phosphomevalonate kinase [Lactobacillus equicursoris DSM 19284 = JCM 14600 = CIP 110162]|uniref:phosphomevalonate kinase n=1 Tax=Lactobacillus equicursoris DSM 19284 = JCM 14600 = CIP 110162 TaxID=1293597 RepID=K0NLK7_9LACO|nr:phosphomevalonate kinase [Lactobacillus equicursoris]KRL03409.1 phosphomevalonate kinase [Lactobacillus equicursoris DSM 19284 = JCM 14600 = CIP 110162]CCK86257.1 Phosphomevalonate kinase [Lactobacillus equicursoris DSM 19284 = JCM 14600 = CIP 110162]
MITEKAPGKLYIAGEYAVLEQDCPAILVALDQYVRVSIKRSASDTGLIHSKQYSQDSIHWVRQGSKMVIDNRDNPFEYILSAISFTERYCLEKNVKMDVYDLFVNSDLDSADGKKYGLGSSAAVTVATVKAILHFYGVKATKDLVYKLSTISHYSVQGNGSAGDIAASVYGGWIAYQTFNKTWLAEELAAKRLSDVVSEAWPGLKIQELVPPEGMDLLVGWSQQPASTSRLVDKTNANKKNLKAEYAKFLEDSRNCVLKMIKGFEENNIKLIQKQIAVNRRLLQHFAAINNIAIEIPRLTELIEIANKFGGAAKTSGAGNGDCGIVIVNQDTNVDLLRREWLKNNILPLEFHIHHSELTF